ncbi:MAG: FRG domain-containing protein [Adhaeribacter sp.]
MDRFITTRLENWNDINQLKPYFLMSYVFRGQPNFNWPLSTSIERSILTYAFFQSIEVGYESQERNMIDEFKRKYHLFSRNMPNYMNSFEWLSIMQHHGAATRLLDFTQSLMVAVYFAIMETRVDSAIWFVNRKRLSESIKNKFELDYCSNTTPKEVIDDYHIAIANKFIGENRHLSFVEMPKAVIPLEPKISNERLSRQQGLFLMPTNSKSTFYANLTSSFDYSGEMKSIKFRELIKYSDRPNWENKVDLIKLEIAASTYSDILYSLKQMNMTAEVLFPGVDGLAKSLLEKHVRE